MEGLIGLSKPGIYSLEANGFAYFGYSLDILVTVSRVISELRLGLFKIQDMEGKPLNLHIWHEMEGGEDIETLKLRCQYLAKKWETEQGGVLWNPAIKSLIRWQPIIRVDMKRKCVNVLLKGSGRGERLVGVFKRIEEAESWVTEFYSPENNPMMLPIYACNSLTSERYNSVVRGMM